MKGLWIGLGVAAAGAVAYLLYMKNLANVASVTVVQPQAQSPILSLISNAQGLVNQASSSISSIGALASDFDGGD